MASTTLSRTPSSAGNRKTFTISTWVKRGNIISQQCLFSTGNGTSNPLNFFGFANDRFAYWEYSNSTTNISDLQTNRLFRDTSAWSHIVVAVDTTQATSSDRIKIYVNGVQETSFSTATYPSQNTDLGFNLNQVHDIGRYLYTGTAYFDGSMSHFHFIDGTAYDASTFGEYDAQNVWKPKTAPSVTYGTNGFFLKFANAGSLGTDSSGNGNDFTVNGTGTQTLDTPSNVFATLNPLHKGTYLSGSTFSNGNTTFTSSATGGNYPVSHSTLAASKGKWYCEMKLVSAAAGINGIGSGICDGYLGQSAYEYGLYGNGTYYNNDTGTSYSTSFSNNDILGIAMDLDNNKLYFAKNGVWQNSGDPTSGATGTGAISITAPASTDTGVYHFAVCDGSTTLTATTQCNFGNGYYGTTEVSTPNADGDGYGKFEYSVPTGYYALCTKNIKTYG